MLGKNSQPLRSVRSELDGIKLGFSQRGRLKGHTQTRDGDLRILDIGPRPTGTDGNPLAGDIQMEFVVFGILSLPLAVGLAAPTAFLV